MSFKASFNDLDVQTLSQKVRRLEYWFGQGVEHITEESLGSYNMIKKRIKELNPDYKIGENYFFSIKEEGERIIGKITKLERFHMEVEILYPYVNWKNYRSVSPIILRGAPNPFIIKWKELSEEILRESYKKIKMIDEKIDELTEDFNNLTEEIAELENIQRKEIKERIVKKLNDWFYHDHIFVSCVTGMIATISERPVIEEIIKVYKNDKKKLYLKKDDMSLKIPFKEMDIQMLSQKLRRLEHWFKENTSNITDESLDNYNLLKKRILELKENEIPE